MTVAAGNSRKFLIAQGLLGQGGAVRPVLWAIFWSSAAYLTLSAFRLGQARIQPDAIATGIPGFFYRLVIRPIEWAMNAVVKIDPAQLGLQAASIVAICAAIAFFYNRTGRSLGGDHRTTEAY